MGLGAVVVGAAGGIGAAVARRLLTDGYRVCALDRDRSSLMREFQDLQGDAILCAEVDVTDAMSVADSITAARSEFGDLSAAVNAAGIGAQSDGIQALDLLDFQRVVDVNLTGTARCMQSQAQAMIETGGGSIVNISSVLGSRGMAGVSAYVAAKHGVEGLTKASALDLASQGIRVNCVVPGFIDTNLLRSRRNDDELKAIAQLHALRRLGKPEEVASVVSFLCSDESRFVTGSMYSVDGGFLSS